MEMKNIADGSKFGSSTATMAKAIGGKTARPCDVCRRERSRWYCAADEAYLCDDCDGSVHTANSVARRHERMRLEPIKAEPKREDHSNYNSAFMATRKRTRTSRPHPHGNHRSLKPKTVKDEFRSPVPVEVPVPENSPSEEFRPAVDEDDDLLHKVPVFVPLAEEFCVSTRTSNLPGSTTSTAIKIDRTSPSSPDQNYSSDCARNPAAMANNCDLNHFLDSETDLCEFAVDMEMDMESIIGQGLDEGLGVLGSLYGTEKDHHRTSNKRDYNNCRSSLTRDSAAQRETDGASSELDHPCAEDGDGSLGWLWGRIKVEDQKDAKTAQLASDTCHKIDPRDALDARVKVEDPDESWDTIELNIDCNELAAAEEEELDEGQEPYTTVEPSDIKLRGDHVDQDVKIKLELDSIFRPSVHTDFSEEKKLISLRLNYEDVLTAWSDRGSPWACGKRPESVSDDCSSDGAGLVPDLSIPNGQLGEQVELGQVPVMNNGGGHGGREARVLRYREKRRTRLFSKKIRYEVRKLNAEKRPRMKGRFVKRTSRMSSD